jgi:hypothetical protein
VTSVVLPTEDGSVEIDTTTASIRQVTVGGRELLDPAHTGSLMRLAVPVEGYAAHHLDLSLGEPTIEQRDEGLRLVYERLTSESLDLAVHVEIDVASTDAGVVLRAWVRNDSDVDIPQVVFPQVFGIVPGPAEPTRLQLPGRRMLPLTELAMRPDDLSFLEVPMQEYIYYGCLDLTMKWFDIGDAEGGLTVYWRSPRYTTQGLLVELQDRSADRTNLRWAQYPTLSPGQEWDSDEIVLLPHAGDWHVGAEAYRQFTKDHYVYDAPAHIREALAIRSLWPALRNTRPTFRFDQLPDYVEEVADPDLGVGEVVLWHWWLKNGYPIIIDERLGSENDLRSALTRCHEIGVPVSMFVSHHILRDTDETDPDWLHRNATGQAVVWNWTYSDEYVPKFPVLFAATHSMIKASALSPGWRKTGLEEYRRAIDLGGHGICFDVFYAWGEPNYSASADGQPDEEGERLIEFAHAARELIRERRPDGSFSGEWPSDLKVPVIDYTWDWRNAYDVADCAPFRYVFPEFRLNANVGAHPRGPVTAFMEGALLNVMPGGLRTQRLADLPDLVALLKSLATLRRRFLPFFTEGRYRHLEAATVAGGDARAYTLGTDALVVVTNPTDQDATVSVTVDLDRLGLDATEWTVEAHSLDGSSEPRETTGVAFRSSQTLRPDHLVVLHLRCRKPSP